LCPVCRCHKPCTPPWSAFPCPRPRLYEPSDSFREKVPPSPRLRKRSSRCCRIPLKAHLFLKRAACRRVGATSVDHARRLPDLACMSDRSERIPLAESLVSMKQARVAARDWPAGYLRAVRRRASTLILDLAGAVGAAVDPHPPQPPQPSAQEAATTASRARRLDRPAMPNCFARRASVFAIIRRAGIGR
jgi:hypothetical protein